jgi:hypothetical protein
LITGTAQSFGVLYAKPISGGIGFMVAQNNRLAGQPG